MDLRRLAMLRELADRGSVGAVADEMDITASAVSQQLKVLEREAGATLLEPDGRGVRLTAAGRELARTATELSIAVERAEASWRTYLERPAGEVTLTAFPTGGEMLLPGLLRRLDGSGVRLMCTDRDPTQRYEVLDMVHDFDVVVADSPAVTERWRERRVQLVPLFREPLDVVLPEGHRLAAAASVAPADVADETWIGAPPGFPYDRILQQVAGVTGRPLQITQRFDDNGIVEAVVAAGHGIAILPRFTVRTRGGGLVTRPLVGVRAHREVAAVVRPDRLERPSVQLVLRGLREEAAAVAARHDDDR